MIEIAGITKYKVRGVFRKKSVLLLLILIFSSLTVATAALTYYGQNVGNFVVGVTDDASKLGLILSEDPNFSYSKPRLVGPSLSDAKPTTITAITPDYSRNTNGSYISKSQNYMGYTFFLKNEGEEAVNVEVSLTISDATKNVDKCIRVWIFEGENDSLGTVYQMADEKPTVYEDYKINPVSFVDNSIVCNTKIPKFLPNEVKKYTVIVWIEGDDPECTDVGEDSILGGIIRFSMKFAILEQVDQQNDGGKA